jgi:hypothetical protein
MSAAPTLSEPVGREPIDPATLAYFRQRNKGNAYNTVIEAFEQSGISQTDLAARLHKGTDQVSRWLGSPGNWTLDTYSDLLFSICGGEITHTVSYPLSVAASNYVAPQWMTTVSNRFFVAPSMARTPPYPTTAGTNTIFLQNEPAVTYQSVHKVYLNVAGTRER